MFDLGIYKVGEAREYTFTKEGIIRLGCNLHANMSAYIAVVNAPSYVVTDDQGKFSFNRLAPGKYKLRAWSEKSKVAITQDITIKVGKNDITVGVTGDATELDEEAQEAEIEAPRAVSREDAVQHERVNMNVQIERSPESLDHDDASGPAIADAGP